MVLRFNEEEGLVVHSDHLVMVRTVFRPRSFSLLRVLNAEL